MDLPQYRSHKIVRAAKVVSVKEDEKNATSLIVEFPDGHKQEEPVPKEFQNRHAPQVGGYLVIYDDGYRSWSPAQAFEQGYTLLEVAPVVTKTEDAP